MTGTFGQAGCAGGSVDRDPDPTEAAFHACTHPDTYARGTGAVDGAVSRLQSGHVADSDGVFGTPVASKGNAYVPPGGDERDGIVVSHL